MAENSEWRLPALSDEHKDWIINARAVGMSYEEITVHFQEVYPDYATDIPSDVFPPLFTHRIKVMLDSSQSSAKHFLDAKKNGEIPIAIEAIPLTIPHIRLICYQRLWDETPARTLQRVVETADGEVKVYKENTRERLAILTEFRKELELLGMGSENNTPFGDPARTDDIKLVKNSGLWESKDADTTETE